jgi:drug/metabolite transporter (DMT)-like permease
VLALCGDSKEDWAMVELWIPLTIGAAFMQNVRSMLQKSLKGELGTSGATFVRFLYALPVAALYVVILLNAGIGQAPSPSPTFAAYVCVGGLAQIMGTALLVSLFDQRSFAVATTYSKTETVQAALFAAVVLGEFVSVIATIGIAVGLLGVVVISMARSQPGEEAGGRRWQTRAMLVGLGSGGAFGIAAVAYRGASLSLGGEGFAIQSAFTLFFVLLFQTIVMGFYMLVRERDELRACLRTWRVSAWVGISGALASAGWFSAMTLENAAMVRSVGQIELIFTLATSALFFGERISKTELLGMGAVSLGILILLQG